MLTGGQAGGTGEHSIHTQAGITGMSVKQTAMSESTPEAELVAMAKAIRTEGIPLLGLLEAITHHLYGDNHKVELIGYEDNEATEKIIEKGYSPNLRHMGRVHGVSIQALYEALRVCFFAIERERVPLNRPNPLFL